MSTEQRAHKRRPHRTRRAVVLRHLERKRGMTEQPPGSNHDLRRYGIGFAQRLCAGGGTWLEYKAWCGVWAFFGLWKAKVPGISWRQASVALIEDDARHSRAPYRRWLRPSQWKYVYRGDHVVLFGRGVHVETVRGFAKVAGRVYVVTDGGNTSPAPGSGSESNGGGAFRRVRPLSDVHGFAQVKFYPKRSKLTALAEGWDKLQTRLVWKPTPDELLALDTDQAPVESADARLWHALEKMLADERRKPKSEREHDLTPLLLLRELDRLGFGDFPTNQEAG